VARRAVPLIAAAAVVISGMAYSLWWDPVVHHTAEWLTGLDIWGTFKAAHYIGYGDISDIYGSGSGFIATPGILVVLAPVAFVAHAFGLTESFPIQTAHPSAWPLLGVWAFAAGTFVLFPLDAVAEEIGVTRGRRAVLTVLEGMLLWPAIVIWGHPEDPIAIGFALYGLLYTMRGRWAKCGWMFGLAVAFQPVALLTFPLALALAPDLRQRALLILRGALPTLVLVALPLSLNWHETTQALVVQPTYPSINHPTPWLSLSPVVSADTVKSVHSEALAKVDGRLRYVPVITPVKTGDVVAPGPSRLIAVGVAVALGLWAWRRRPSPGELVWLAAAALSCWCFFEPVMVPYYLWAPLAVTMVAAAPLAWWRLGLVALFAAVATRYSYRNVGPWEWWLPETALLLGALAAAWPFRRAVARHRPTPIAATEHIVSPPVSVPGAR